MQLLCFDGCPNPAFESCVCLNVNVDGEVRAYENRCPHQAWPLDQGDLDGRELTCVNHHWVFDVVTGAGVNPADCALTAFPVRVDETAMICVATG